jgi:hypothetical protein
MSILMQMSNFKNVSNQGDCQETVHDNFLGTIPLIILCFLFSTQISHTLEAIQ